MSDGSLTLSPVGHLQSPYRDKFAVPRQPDLVRHARGRLQLLPPFNDPHTLRGIEQYTHLWLIFHFHQCPPGVWHPTVRPPRLGGNERMGVFATRSPFRPNPLGLSVVRLLGVGQQGGQVWLDLEGVDLVDGTPIFDIKPYVPFVDSQPEAHSDFAAAPPQTRDVAFSAQAEADLTHASADYPHLRDFIHDVLAQDPRPAYHQEADADREYGMHLYDFNVRWQMQGERLQVLAVTPWPAESTND